MIRFLVRRTLSLIPILLFVSLVSFSALHFSGVDPARAMAGPKASSETIQRIREQHNFNDPFLSQYTYRMKKIILDGDLGRSFQTNQPITKEIAAKFPATVELTLAAILLALVFGVLFGVLSAVYRHSIIDYLSLFLALIGVSIPVFFLGMILILLFSGDVFPVSGRMPSRMILDYNTTFYIFESLVRGDFDKLQTFLRHLFLPAVALSTIPMAVITRITRSAMLEVLDSDYVRTARAKGVHEFFVITKHALRNASIQITTIGGVQLGYLLGGAILTETVFSWPGMGKYLVNRVNKSDFMAVQGGLLVTATAFVLVNLLVDLSYFFLDPRTQSEEGG